MDKFQKQSETTCINKAEEEIADISRRDCESICLHYRQPCDGYEMFDKTCYIVTEDKGEHAEWKTYEGCTHYQRLCIS